MTTLNDPSKVIQHHETVIQVEGMFVKLTLVTMKRSFLLVVGDISPSKVQLVPQSSDFQSRDAIIRGFMNSNPKMKGLSLAIGQHSTCIIESDNSLASATLASRLSKKLNKNQPVYVANNMQLPQDELDSSGFMAKLYMGVFQFVGAHYSVA